MAEPEAGLLQRLARHRAERSDLGATADRGSSLLQGSRPTQSDECCLLPPILEMSSVPESGLGVYPRHLRKFELPNLLGQQTAKLRS
jgi:hypothetical protein